MKKIICLLLALLLTTAVLTSCDLQGSVAKLKDFIDYVEKYPGSTTDSSTQTDPIVQEATTPEPEVTTPEPEVTTPEPEVTTPEPEITPPEPQVDYGTLNTPVRTTYAYEACANLADGESSPQPFYVKGTVTKIGEVKNYYKNVYFTDGETEMLIYTINMGDGISGFAVGDTITAYGYIKNYMGTIEMATYNSSVYVYVVKVDSAGGNQGGGNTPDHIYTDFTDAEKSLFNSIVGLVIPFIPNDDYYVDEYEYDNEIGISFYTFGNTQAEFDAYRALFSFYTYDGSEKDEFGDTWYLYSKGDVYVDMSFYYYEDSYVVDIYIYIIKFNFSIMEILH